MDQIESSEEMHVDDDESQDSIASTSALDQTRPQSQHAQPPQSSARAAFSTFSLSSTPVKPVKKEESHDSIIMQEDDDDEKPSVKAEDPILAPPPTPPKPAPEMLDLSFSSPVKPTLPSSSAPARRTPEEQAAQKAAALKRLEANKLAKIAASAVALTESLRAEREEKRRALAAKSLGAFGFTISVKAEKTGLARFGTGKGGESPAPTMVPGPLGAMGFEANQAPPEVYAPNPMCSDEQSKVLEEVRQGKMVFFTGSAGVGKSFLLSEITRLLNYIKRPYQVCATTGIAALQVQGTTIHSWAGIGLGKESVINLYDRIMNKKEKRQNWTDTQVLIVDEISMIDPGLFTKLNLLGKLIRQNSRPFGGIQIIVSGDFFQLPPVPEKHPLCARCGHETSNKVKPDKSTLHYEALPPGAEVPEIRKCVDSRVNQELKKGCNLESRTYRFAFETETWAECDFQVMELTRVFRQSDADFISMLEKFRRGICDQPCLDLLASCGTALSESGSIKPTNLYPLRASVDKENEAEFRKLEGKAYNFEAADDSRGPRGESAMRERLKDVPGQPKLHLKLGAQVLLLTNLDPEAGLVNGSRGVIVDWIPSSQANQQEGAANAAPPRRKGAPGGGFGSEEWRAKAAEDWVEKQGEDMLPVVFWACGATKTVQPFCWVIDVDKDNTVARTQLPLQLAWALTIHKSQGQSLDAVGVRLNGTFEKGQAYVALSRCRTPAGMKVDGFRANLVSKSTLLLSSLGHKTYTLLLVVAHPTVIAFYDRIKLHLPFLASPPPPINPLSFVPDFSPLMAKYQRIFGHMRPPLPPGTPLGPDRLALDAATAPGPGAPLFTPNAVNFQLPVVPPPPPPPHQSLLPNAPPARHFPSPAPLPPAAPPVPPAPSPFDALPPASTAWENLLRQSIEAFKSSSSASPSVLLDQARQLVAQAFEADEENEDDDEDGESERGSSMDVSESQAAGQSQSQGGTKRPRKSRKGRRGGRVGH